MPSQRADDRSSDPTALRRPVPIGQRLAPGLRIGPYELIRELGHGGMATVHLARDTRLGRRVAIKFLLEKRREVIEAFLREARATAACEHENIVLVYAVDEYEGVPYMVLEYLEGKTLRELLGGRKLPALRAVELIVPVLRALVRAHDLNIVHRDLKPENVFLTNSGTLKVLDFGIAALFDDARARAPANSNAPTAPENPGDDGLLDTVASGMLAGTPAYMSPEQFEQGDADARADVWAVGVMLFEMLAGQHPIQPLNMSTLHNNAIALDGPMPSIGALDASLPPQLVHAVDRCLQKRRELRWHSAQDVLNALELLIPSRAPRSRSDDLSPYPGLMSFQESESDRFFGREREIRGLVARLPEVALMGVIGPSGIGKSSFLRAGVVPALKQSGEVWEAFVLRPGRQPLHALGSMLHSGGTTNSSIKDRLFEHENLIVRLRQEPGYLGSYLRALALRRGERIVLIVDQFEELYTLVHDDEERRAFLACLSGVADDPTAPLRVLLSLRSDFLDRVGDHKHFADELSRVLVFLQPLGRDGLREALVAPLQQLGYNFENDDIIEDMVRALSTTPGALPLLQFAGSKLWEARDRVRKLITTASYQELGGITGVLAQHADQVINALPPGMQALTRTLFQRLITAEGTRAVVSVVELVDLVPNAAEVRLLVDQLLQARLLVLQDRAEEGGTVELIHESLITGWPLLRRWMEEGREDAAFREQLQTAARQWDARGRPAGLLWRGESMQDARRWRARQNDRLPKREQAYLDAVFSLANRAERRQRIAIATVIGVLSLVIAFGSALLIQVQRAEQAARHAEQVSRDRADSAKHERDRARAAESRVKSQLELVEREQAARARAQAEVKQGKEDLRAANAELELSLKKTEAESLRATASANDAQKLAASLQSANDSLEMLLRAERERAERLEHERSKILTELR